MTAPQPQTGQNPVMPERPPAPERDGAAAPELARLVGRTLLESSREAFYILDREWRFVHLNRQAERLVGRKAEELVGRVVWEEFPEAVGTKVQEEYRRAVADGESVSFEIHYPPLGTWFEIHADPADDLLVVHFRDVGARRAAEAALQASEERFHLAAEAANDMLWDHDFARDRLWWSDQLRGTLGHAPEAVVTFGAWEALIHPDDRERVVASIHEAVEGEHRHWSGEYRVQRADGEYAHVLDRALLLYDDAGEPRRTIGSLMDITHRKVAEARQRFLFRAGQALTATLDYRQRLRDLARVCAGPLSDYCIVDIVEEDGTVHRLEAAHADADRAELVRGLVRSPPLRESNGGVARALGTGEPVLVEQVDDAELRAIARTPEHLEILRALAPHTYLVVPLRAKKRTLGAITLALSRPGRRFREDDVTLARDLARQAALDLHNARLHRDVERARQAAEEASHVKGQFLAMMSHELRTPLTAIIGSADLMESEATGALTARQKEQLARVKASAWHLVVLIDEILAYSRMEAGAEQLRVERADAGGIAREAVHMFLPQAQAMDLELECVVPDEPVIIETDPGKLRQVVMNLIANALKFTGEGRVSVALAVEAEQVALRISDTGAGIAEADHERIFQPFVQAEDASTRKHGGTGLGLAISRRLARMMGGDVVVESVPGQGSTFTILLPRPVGS